MKIRYLLKKKENDFLIYVALYELDETVVISTGQHITKGEWSVKDNKPKDHRSAVAKAIEKVKAEVMKAIIRLEGIGEDPTPAVCKKGIRKNAMNKPVYRIFFYQDGPPKSAISDDLICLWSYPVYGDGYPHPCTSDKELIKRVKAAWKPINK